MEEHVEYIEVEIDTEEIENYLFTELTASGFVPTKEETHLVSEIFFDFLIHKGIAD